MRMAISLAKRAEGKTSPNPIVGAVVVKNGRIVGEGYHKRAGSPHAEINALRQAGNSAKGATLYVTLEPCGHFGRTPPCTNAIIKSGIKKVVIGMKDPNPINNGRSIRKLNKNGIKVITGVLREEAEVINKPYIKFITKRLPFITVKVAQSMDGKIATKTGDSRWISSEDSRRYVHKLRGMADAVMVGANTALKDDPLLMSRYSGKKQPVRIVITGRSRIPSNARIFSHLDKSPVMIARPGSAGNKKTGLVKFLKGLAGENITHVLVEGGGELIASLVEKGLVDRFLIFIAPKIIGGKDAITAVEGSGVEKVKDAFRFRRLNIKRFKEDILIDAER
ncbi:MAG: bifunctional diaminohydroxyphosphoribosylaminopyrimidine deaminase/5-amino-6-(5-phosphoribosylamino)uracil reductase RibD [Candidatus Omnitrophica bacterium]|nr:bifunctional diaminohydroxyphosphoribosylaminopyrimidine deaminase/5-amino-6-(5-phosphoribosylamino)uracil reductase RibD [Candidatus Omnitrophota bacterium]